LKKGKIVSKVEETKLFEELYPGKLSLVESINNFNQVADAYSDFKQEYDAFIDNNSSLIYANSDAVLWSDDEKISVVLSYKTLGAFEVWISALDSALKRSGENADDISLHNLTMAIIKTHTEIFSTMSKFQGTIFLAGDESLKKTIFPNHRS
jgi:hypothetical protein